MLKVEQIKKSFNQNEAVRGISFHVDKGEAFGLLGPNGAGKSTTISMICGLLSCDHGEVFIDGTSMQKNPLDAKKKIGIVPQEIALYPTLSAKDNLLFWGRMYGLGKKEARKRAEEVLELTGLSSRGKEKIGSFSGGMKRRINIGASLMHEPQLLIMDEPTVGIDPQSRSHILETIKHLNSEGTTIIYTSHYMEEVEALCTRIGIVDQGRMIASGTKEELCSLLAYGTILVIELDRITPEWLAGVKDTDGVEKAVVKEGRTILEIFVKDGGNPLPDLISQASRAGLKVEALKQEEPNLESLFLQLTGRTLRD